MKVRNENYTPTSLVVFIISGMILLRTLVGFHSHSGQGDDHGGKAAYGGDFEAQRHWLEITLNLHISEWYHHDLEYWGLDYPPLTAYVSYICGIFSYWMVGPESVELHSSRGIEDPVHKSFMRGTVLVLDLLIYFPAVWIIAKSLNPNNKRIMSFISTVILCLSQPAIILIDHGHFQYNTTALGLSLWSFYFMTKKNFSNCIIGSVLFCAALNFKQMTLYYAPAVFVYLLGRCFSHSNWSRVLYYVSLLGVAVILSFSMLWFPFYFYPHKDMTCIQSIAHVLRRLFPFQRGLFEGKVSNLWCALSVKPVSIRKRVPVEYQPICALLLTLLLLAPMCLPLFQIGCSSSGEKTKIIQQEKQNSITQAKEQERYHLKSLLIGTTMSALAFFLASFQVHEKSILMALAPLSMLISEDFAFVGWFSLVSVWTLWPLLIIDHLMLAYTCCVIMFISLLTLAYISKDSAVEPSPSIISTLLFLNSSTSTVGQTSSFGLKPLLKMLISLEKNFVIPVSMIVMMILHVFEFLVDVPRSLPDLFTVIWVVVGCALFVYSWARCSFVLSLLKTNIIEKNWKKIE